MFSVTIFCPCHPLAAQPELRGRPLRMLDVSCGFGLSTIAAAAKGHNVRLGRRAVGEREGSGMWDTWL